MDIEKKSSPKAHISFWSGDVDLVYWNDITLKNGWNRYDYTYSMASTQYIPVSMVKDNMLKIKFDGHGILNYKVGTFIVTLTFYK